VFSTQDLKQSPPAHSFGCKQINTLEQQPRFSDTGRKHSTPYSSLQAPPSRISARLPQCSKDITQPGDIAQQMALQEQQDVSNAMTAADMQLS
jgi:hypothetical protein